MAQYKGPASESQRVRQLQASRERDREEIELKKRKLADELKVDRMETKFSAHYDAVETNLKSATVGLLTMEEMKTRQEEAVREREMLLARKSKEDLKKAAKEERAKEKAKELERRKIKTLSFDPDEEDEDDDDDEEDGDGSGNEEEEEEEETKRKRFGKDPGVETHFLVTTCV